MTFVLLPDGLENPLPGLAAYREFQEALKPCIAAPPAMERGEALGAHGF